MNRSNERTQRIITGTALAGAVLLVCFLPSVAPSLWLLLPTVALLVVGLAAWEFSVFSLAQLTSERSVVTVGSVFPALLAWMIALLGVREAAMLIALIGGSALICWCLVVMASTRRGIGRGLEVLPLASSAFLLLGLGGAALVAVSALPSAGSYLVWLIAVAATNDIAAYFGGRAFQGPKLHPVVSPNKTVSGSLSGLCAGVLVSMGLFTLSGFSAPSTAILVGVLVVLTAQGFDLIKSLAKRICGVKDSGNLLPGHGGVLDRIDATLGAAVIGLLASSLRG